MIRGQDVVVLLKLHTLKDRKWTFRSFGEELGYDAAGVSRSLARLGEATLYDPHRRRPRVAQSEEFLVHAIKYVFPAKLGAPVRGFPTAWAAPPLSEEIASDEAMPPVWPHRRGTARGAAVRPLHRLAVEAAERDGALRELLALLDALRIGEARERRLASHLLRDRLRALAA